MLAVWSASGYVAAFMRAANAIWDAPEGRPIWKTVGLRIGVTVIALIVLAIGAVIVVVTGPVAQRVGDLLGLGSAAVTAWEIAKWPVLVAPAGTAPVACCTTRLRTSASRAFRWVTPGGVLAIVLWVVASAVFALYVATFASYNKTYGALAGVIVFLIWLWMSNIAILLGAEFNAELERQRQIRDGHPPDEEPFLPLRDEPAG